VQLAVIVLNALLVVAVSAAALGEKTAPGDLWRRVRRRVPAAIGLALLTGLTVAVVLVAGVSLFAVPGALLISAKQPVAGILLILLALGVLVVLAIALAVYLSVSAPALLLENLGPARALRRSGQLVRGSFWRTLLILGVGYLIVTIGSSIIVVPLAVVVNLLDAATGNALHTQFWWNVAGAAVAGVGQIIAGAVLRPWWSAVVAIVYIDLRMRREGLDLELLRATDAQGPA
jgi:hypothetical protein